MIRTQEWPARGVIYSIVPAVVLWLLCCVGCLSVLGCTPIIKLTPAATMYGDAQKAPALEVTKVSPLWGLFGAASARAGGDFSGTVDATYDPATGGFTLKGTVANNPTPVWDAQGRVITAMDPTRLAEIATLTERQKIVSEAVRDQWIAGFNMVKDIGTAAVGAFIAKTRPAFPETGGLPPGVNLDALLASMGSGKPFELPKVKP